MRLEKQGAVARERAFFSGAAYRLSGDPRDAKLSPVLGQASQSPMLLWVTPVCH